MARRKGLEAEAEELYGRAKARMLAADEEGARTFLTVRAARRVLRERRALRTAGGRGPRRPLDGRIGHSRCAISSSASRIAGGKGAEREEGRIDPGFRFGQQGAAAETAVSHRGAGRQREIAPWYGRPITVTQ